MMDEQLHIYPTNTINPTLLWLFRLFAYVQIGISGAFVLLRWFSNTPRTGPIQLVSLLIFVATALFLRSTYLQRRLRGSYLPVALIAVTIGLSLGRPFVQLYALGDGQGPLATILRTLSYGNTNMLWDNESTPMLFFPLVLIAWQYSTREVLLFIAVTVGIDVLIYASFAARPPEGLLNLLILVAARSVTFLFVGYIVTVLSRILKEQRDALQQANRKLVHYMAALDQLATSRERNRLARELHDTLAHSLSATALQLEASSALWQVNPDKSHALLEQSLATTRAGLTETRRALESLRATPLDDLGLLLSLRQLARTSAEQGGYQLELDLPEQVESLPVEVEQTIYRCAQEAFANIGRHAAASHVRLRLTCQDSQAELWVEDDGRGFDLKELDQSKHFGIVGMQERADMFGGKFEITSQPGDGTTIHLWMGGRS
ncbi:MAG: sensor histidine kinase [Anaerolineae bacterium]|nr:sensor histidine kinase [Anaerolineae bacterium]